MRSRTRVRCATSTYHTLVQRPTSMNSSKRRIVRMSQVNQNKVVNLVWMRCGDLRTHDHEPLARTFGDPKSCLPFFCLDDAQLGPSLADKSHSMGLPSMGPYRLVALLRAVADVKSSLRGRGIDLMCASGRTVDCIPALLASVSTWEVRPTHVTLSYYADSGSTDPVEKQIEDRVIDAFKDAMSQRGWCYQILPFWGATMHHPEDLLSAMHGPEQCSYPEGPYASFRGLKDIPSMTDFSKLLSAVPVRKPCCPCCPPSLADTHTSSVGLLSNLLSRSPDHLGLRTLFVEDGQNKRPNVLKSAIQILKFANSDVQKAYQRLSDLVGFDILEHALQNVEYTSPVTETEARDTIQGLGYLDDYRQARMLAWGNHVGAKLSVCLSLGSLSPRTIYWEVIQKYSNKGKDSSQQQFPPAAADPGHVWLLFHIKCIRDYFIFSSMGDGPDLLAAAGPRGLYPPELVNGWMDDKVKLERWIRGETGFPFVDASMRQLVRTGEMSNRCRQNVASFLTRTLRQDWRQGVEVFRALLIDHDAAINAENWAYISGVGHDPRSQSRTFKTVTQGEKYDANGSFIIHFLPQLAGLPLESIHRPWTSGEDGNGYVLAYPAIVDPSTQIGRKGVP